MMNGHEDSRTVEGTLTALSHTFILTHGISYVIELCCKGTTSHIIVEDAALRHWRTELSIGKRYQITELRHHKFCKSEDKVLRTSATSLLKSVDGKDEADDVVLDKRLITCKGIVTAIVDEELGIYELDKKVYLVVSYLNCLTGEIWCSEYRKASPKSKLPQDTVQCNADGFLRVGDLVTLFHVHYFKISGKTYLACCGRSLLTTDRIRNFKSSKTSCSSSILDIVHTYSPSILGLKWLIDTKDYLTKILCPYWADEEEIEFKSRNGEKTFMDKIVEEAVRRDHFKIEPRSLLKEFLFHDDHCVLYKKPSPPSLYGITIKHMKESIILEDEQLTVPTVWRHKILQMKKGFFLVGCVKLGSNGILQIYDNADSIDMVLLGSQSHLLHEPLVAVFNFSLVVEEFNILHAENYYKTQKKYIIADASDVILLSCHRRQNDDRDPFEDTEMTIVLKSNLMHSRAQSEMKKTFIAKAFIKLTHFGGEIEKWETFLCFSGKLALTYPVVEVGHSYQIYTGVENPEVMLKKAHENSCLMNHFEILGTKKCVDVPESTLLVDVSSSDPHINPVDVKKALSLAAGINDPISVVGIIKDRQLMTSKFSSEKSFNSVNSCKDGHVGIPGDKILRILLCDSLGDSSCTIWVYFKCSSSNCILQYPLATLPGMKVTISFLLKETSKNKNMYLKCTNFTIFTPLSLPKFEQPISHDVPYQYLKFALQDHNAFWVIAHILRVDKVILHNVCSNCQSEIIAGDCSYQGCHSSNGEILKVYCQILIDDGSACSMVVVTSPEQLQLILRLKDNEFAMLKKEIRRSGQKLNYHYLQQSKAQENSNTIASVFMLLCSCNDILRSMKFECRRFKSKPQAGGASHLFCLDAQEIIHDIDYLMWEKKIKAMQRTEGLGKK